MENIKIESMADVIKAYVKERRDSKEVSLLKDKPKRDGSGGINLKLQEAIKKAIENAPNIQTKDNKNSFEEIRKRKKRKDQSLLEFQQEKMRDLVTLAKNIGLDIQNIIDEYNTTVSRINEYHDVSNWLSENCKNASGISFATHVIKLTHSRIKGATNILDEIDGTKESYLTTTSIKNIQYDSALDNAAYASVATLLKLGHIDQNGVYKTLADYIRKGDRIPFGSFTNDQSKIDEWIDNLKKAFDSDRKSSHFLAKQIYFPSNYDKKEYHLLLPIISSSLAQEIYLKITTMKEQKRIFYRKKDNLYSDELIINFPNLAQIKTTFSNHTNASELNGKRGGKLYLFSTLPPRWKQKFKVPVNAKSLFNSELTCQARDPMRSLRKLLMAIKINKLSRNDPKIHNRIVEYVDEIIDIVFGYVQSIQALKNEAGWTEESSLKESHQLWLDPYRDDVDFQKKRSQKDWKKEIANDFSMWLNKQLESKKLIPGNQLQRLWKDIFTQRFRKFNAIMEADR